MAKGRINDETIRFIFTAESADLRRESEKSKKTLEGLKTAHEELLRQQEEARKSSGRRSSAYKELTKRVKASEQAIADETAKLETLNRRLNTGTRTMADLRKEARLLQIQLDNTSQALNPETYAALSGRLQEVTGRMHELRESTRLAGNASEGGLWKKISGSVTDFSGIKTFLAGNALFKIGEMAFEKVAEYAGRAVDRVKELVAGSIDAAREAQGITHAFEQLDRPGILDNLRKATHGTVTDVELMKAAVQANDFRLPLDQLGKYLEFAQLKAQQTGQSVDYLTNSIVTGLGRKSLMILDNLGLSASEIKEEMAKTGDMATAVGNIIDRQLSEAGEHFETAAEREAQATTAVSNAQLGLGRQMQKTFGIGSTSFAEMQAKAEVFILNGLTRFIVYCQDAYDRLGSVRFAVEAVKVTFDTLFKVVTAGFYVILDGLRLVGRGLLDAGAIIEAIFKSLAERSIDPIKNAMQQFGSNFDAGLSRLGRHLKDVGTRWGENVIDSMNAVMGKKKVKAPEMEAPKTKTATTSSTASSSKEKTTSASSGDDPYGQLLADREKAYREYGNRLRQMLAEQLLTEDEYRDESTQAELKFLADKMALQDKFGKDMTVTQGQYLDKVISEASRKNKLQEQQEKEAEQNRLKQLKESLSRQQYAYEQGYQQIAGQRVKSPDDFDTLRASTRTAWEQHVISYEQYQKRMTEIAQMESQQRQQIEQTAFNTADQLLASTGALFSALQSRETAQVDAKYKKLIAAAKKQGKDTTKLEEQQEEEKAEIRKKYAQKQFRLQVLQIIAATAQSVANVWKEWAAMPVVAAALTAAAVAQGAVQLATAKAQADQAAGLYQGGYSDDYVEGYTRRGGNPREQAGVIPVHRNEFVANHKTVGNPQVRPLLDVIDRHQRTGDIHLLNATRLLEEAYGRGRYRGGFTTGGNGGTDTVDDEDTSPISGEAMTLLRQIAHNTGLSLTVRTLRDEIAHEEQLERNARRN